MRGAILNPIRFYDSGAMPDWLTIFPNNDNVTFGNQNQYGVLPSPEFIRYHVGNMFLQFLNEDNEIKSFDLYKLDETNTWVVDSSINTVDISPVGWVGYQIHKLTLTGLTDGYYYLIEPDCGCKSDLFYVTSSVDYSEDFVKIKYSNSVNDFGCIFGANYFEAYFRGRLINGEPKIDIDTYEDDRIQPVKLKASPQRTANLSILGMNYLYKDLLDHIFSCDTIEVNGVQYENMEAPVFDLTEGSDMGNITVKLAQSINDYYYG